MLITRKIGMTQIWDEAGKIRPVTVLAVPSQKIIHVKTLEKDGYQAVVVGAEESAKKSMPAREIHEFRFDGEAPAEKGADVVLASFEGKKSATIIGLTKGKGFQGPVKRHGFAMQRKTHGGHGSSGRRKGGSIGNRTWPGEVYKGKKMAGRMGQDRMTLQGRVIERIDAERGVILVRGPVPGAPGTVLTVQFE